LATGASQEVLALMSEFRRIVPAGYATATLTLTGTSPLLMNSGEADRDSDLYRAYYMLGQKKRKSLDDEARLRELEWQLRIYLDEEVGPYIPGKNIKEMLRSAATKWRRGEDIKRSLIVVLNRIPLQYEGPRDQDGLWAEGFRYTAMVANAGFNAGRVVRCRPMFPKWSVEAELAYDPEDIDADFLRIVIERSQKYGLGDYRPEFGSFAAALNGEAVFKESAKGSGLKERNGHQEEAHEAFKSRIMVKAE
jgi:hypothetical protein